MYATNLEAWHADPENKKAVARIRARRAEETRAKNTLRMYQNNKEKIDKKLQKTIKKKQKELDFHLKSKKTEVPIKESLIFEKEQDEERSLNFLDRLVGKCEEWNFLKDAGVHAKKLYVILQNCTKK